MPTISFIFALLVSTLASAGIVRKDLEYNLAGRKYEGYLAYDDSVKGKRPGVLVAHDWMGVTETTKARVDQLAELGYVAFAVDIYGKGERPKTAQEAAVLSGGFKRDRVPLRNRMHQGLKVLREQPQTAKDKVAVTGYSFGGTAAIELARAGADIKGVVSFHGELDSPKPEDGARIKSRVLALHGADDPFVKPEELAAFEDEMRKHKVDWQLIKYGNAAHSFTEKSAGNDNSKGAAYNEVADRRSWQAMQQFLKEIFR